MAKRVSAGKSPRAPESLPFRVFQGFKCVLPVLPVVIGELQMQEVDLTLFEGSGVILGYMLPGMFDA